MYTFRSLLYFKLIIVVKLYKIFQHASFYCFVSITFSFSNFQSKVFCTKKKTKIALILVILLPIGVNIDIIATHTLIPASAVHGIGHFHSEGKIEEPEKMVCQYDNVAANHYFYSFVKTPVDITVYCFVPFVILMITNSLIICTAIRSKIFRENQNSSTKRTNNQDDDISKMIGMLLSTCLMFIVTTLPSGIYLSLPSVPHEVRIAFQKERFSFLSFLFPSIAFTSLKSRKKVKNCG